MPDKSRAPRKQESKSTARPSEQREQNVATPHAAGDAATQRMDELESRLAQARQELDKGQKISRSLARNCQRAEQNLRRSEDGFELVCRFGSDLIFRLGPEGKLQFLSPASLPLLGHEPSRLIGRRFLDYVHPSDQPSIQRYLQSIRHGTASPEAALACRLLHADGNLVPVEIHVRIMPHPQTSAAEVFGVARLHRPSAQGTASTATTEELALSLAHELNQPLTALTIMAGACARLARAAAMPHEELIQAIDQVVAQAERAGELVRRMRQLAMGGPSQRAMVQLNDLVHDTMQLLDAELQKGKIRPRLQLAEDAPTVLGDPIQVGQVLVNLVRNAIEAMLEVPSTERVLTVTTSSTPQEVVLTVTDTGPGLAPGMAERLFLPHQTTKPLGMGLGLALSRSIVQAHSGRLWVEPPLSRGATFSLALPKGNHGH